MQVVVDADAFEPTNDPFAIFSLIRNFIQGRHFWKVTPEALASLEANMGILPAAMAPIVTALARESLLQTTAYPRRGASITVSTSNMTQVVSDLSRSAVLVVEDVVSDAGFVGALAEIFGSSRVREALDQRWLEIRHGGGSRTVDVAREEQAAFQIVIRVSVLFDSDSLLPGQRTTYHEYADALRAEGIAVHVLLRREAENYLPNRAFWNGQRSLKLSRSKLSRKIEALKRLDESQRGHFDMKIGFKPGEGGPVVPPLQKELFSTLAPETLRTLEGGFGKDVLSCLGEAAAGLHASDFDDMSNSSEIRQLLRMIEDII